MDPQPCIQHALGEAATQAQGPRAQHQPHQTPSTATLSLTRRSAQGLSAGLLVNRSQGAWACDLSAARSAEAPPLHSFPLWWQGPCFLGQAWPPPASLHSTREAAAPPQTAELTALPAMGTRHFGFVRLQPKQRIFSFSFLSN